MELPEIAAARLVSQQVAESAFKKVNTLVSYMGALQAQDYAMVKWALGIRLPGFTEKQIDAALDKGSILRTHVLRPTWHLVAANDIYWMLALTAKQVKAASKFMDKQLELSETIFTRSNTVIERLLQKDKQVLREDIGAALQKAGISIAANRLSHLLIRAELEGIACSGKLLNQNRTYALLEERVPEKNLLDRDESLALLAKKYFTSRGPATLQDFTWWSGLPVKDAGRALEMIKRSFASKQTGGQTYWYKKDLPVPTNKAVSVQLLPAFDECIISYKDRSAALAERHQKKVLSVNGIFNPVIMVNGQATGCWKRTTEKNKLVLKIDFFKPLDKQTLRLLEAQIKAFGVFCGKETVWHNM